MTKDNGDAAGSHHHGCTTEESRTLIVSNRLPLMLGRAHGRAPGTSTLRGEPPLVETVGGLASALRAAQTSMSNALWLGWSGELTGAAPQHIAAFEAECNRRRLLPVRLSPSDVKRYYDGFSNGVLWPLFHGRVERVPLQTADFPAYRAVNRRFAEAIVDHSRPNDVVWIHDFHFCLLPALVRERSRSTPICFFLHIPFPAPEQFGALPWRREILEGLLGADVIAFHTERYRRRFIETALEYTDARCDGEGGATGLTLASSGRHVRTLVAPLGVDAERFAQSQTAIADVDEVAADIGRLRASVPGTRVLLGVDRLDYTKGIPRRILAMDRLLQLRPDLKGKVTLIQIAAPSRENVGSYEDIRREVQRLVGEVNGRHTTLSGVVPVRFLAQAFTQKELASLYRAVDTMVVTPLQDGMNLVAKEFVAARSDNDGVLVLSEFAGAAAQLDGALLVNPYDLDGTARAMARALDLSPAERAARMADLRRVVLAESTAGWAARQLDVCRAAVGARGAGAAGSTSTPRAHAAAPASRADADERLVADGFDSGVSKVVARGFA